MGKQILVHSIDHASYAPQLISVVPKPRYSYGEAYGGRGDTLGGVCSHIEAFGPILATPISR